MLKSIALTAAIILSSVTSSFANPDDDFNAAVDLWLDGNDETSLPALSVLANDGHTNAQIFLAQIERSSSLTSEFVRGLTRKERIALLRHPSGLSGRSWLVPSSEVSELAAALLETLDPQTRMDTALKLYELGENRIADSLLPIWFVGGADTRATLLEMATTQQLPEQLVPATTMFMRMHLDEVSQHIPKMIELGNFSNNLSDDEIYHGRLMISNLIYNSFDTPKDRSNIRSGWVLSHSWTPEEYSVPRAAQLRYRDWIMESSELDILRSPCERACPEDVANCALTAYSVIPIQLALYWGSPTETLLPQDRYVQSERAVMDIVAKLADGALFSGRTPQASACLAELIDAEVARRD